MKNSVLYGSIIIGAFLSLVLINSAFPSFAEAVVTTFKFKTLDISGFGSLTNGTDKITINNKEPTFTTWTLLWNGTSVGTGNDQFNVDEKNNILYVVDLQSQQFSSYDLLTGSVITSPTSVSYLNPTSPVISSSLLNKYISISTDSSKIEVYSNGVLLWSTAIDSGVAAEGISPSGKYLIGAGNDNQIFVYRGS